MSTQNYRTIYFILCALRVAAPFLIFINPVLAIFVILILDMLDGVNASRGGIKKKTYQFVDKGFDLFWYTVSLIYIFSDSQFVSYRIVLGALFAFRLLGTLLYWYTANKIILFVCANFYENILIAIVLGMLVPQLNFLIEPNFFAVTIIIAVVLKIIQEYFAHLVPYSFTEKILRIRMDWKE